MNNVNEKYKQCKQKILIAAMAIQEKRMHTFQSS